jgi:prepilin-type N-terminal cleavage/methylation domain-containing protein
MKDLAGTGRSRNAGFTLIELMIVVAIIGILAAIAIPKFANLIRKSSEGSLKGNIGSVRSALSIYYGDMEGQFPTDLASLTVAGKYLSALPNAKIPDYHASTTVVRENNSAVPCGCGSCYTIDTGQWMYWSDNDSLCGGVPNPGGGPQHKMGDIWVLCNHTDTKGTTWTAY